MVLDVDMQLHNSLVCLKDSGRVSLQSQHMYTSYKRARGTEEGNFMPQIFCSLNFFTITKGNLQYRRTDKKELEQ